jgi:hypothetical protein
MASGKDKQLIYQKIRDYVQTLERSNVPVWRLYLYGSYAKDTYHADSDIDLAVFWDRDDIDGFDEDGISICGLNPILLPAPISMRRIPTSKRLSKRANASFKRHWTSALPSPHSYHPGRYPPIRRRPSVFRFIMAFFCKS